MRQLLEMSGRFSASAVPKGDKKVRMAKQEKKDGMWRLSSQCPASFITEGNGVGCAAAMISAEIRGKKEVACGEDCCG
jgi:hypothetical protein